MSSADWMKELARLHPLLRSADDLPDTAEIAAEGAAFEEEVIVPMQELAAAPELNEVAFIVTQLDAGFVAIVPMTDEAEAWFNANVPYEDYQLLGGLGVTMEEGYAADLVETIRTTTPFTIGWA